jgi:hypothetical protein
MRHTLHLRLNANSIAPVGSEAAHVKRLLHVGPHSSHVRMMLLGRAFYGHLQSSVWFLVESRGTVDASQLREAADRDSVSLSRSWTRVLRGVMCYRLCLIG